MLCFIINFDTGNGKAFILLLLSFWLFGCLFVVGALRTRAIACVEGGKKGKSGGRKEEVESET